ncbi:MAG: hypothetical protein V3573_05685 [Desulfovibrionaceae bacterium]
MGVKTGDVGTLGNLASVVTAAGGLMDRRISDKENRTDVENYEALAEEARTDAEQRARREQKEAREKSGKLREEQRRQRSAARTVWGKSGVKLSSGSPLSVMEGRAAEDEKQRLSLLAEADQGAADELDAGARRSRGYLRKAESLRARAGYGGSGLGAAQTLLDLGRVYQGW